MDTKELLKKVRKIEIKTRGLSNQIFSGEYHSAFKGRGMAFSEVREYYPGDPIRTIDWNVTARLGKPYVKTFEEEREITVMLIIDMSGSQAFGSKTQFKRELVAEICAVLAFSAIQNNDKVGAMFFTDRVEKFIAPSKGKSHILRIIRELLEFSPEHKGTDIGDALAHLTNYLKKRSTCFLISDFIVNQDYEKSLAIASKRHDLVAVRITDDLEEEIPDLGVVPIKDAETGNVIWLDTSDASFKKEHKAQLSAHRAANEKLLRKTRIDHVEVHTGRNYVQPLMRLFKKRESRR